MTETARPPRTGLKLRIVTSRAEGVAGREIALAGQSLSIGRVEGNEVVVADQSMSRRHASLELLPDGRVIVRDNGSSNGVVVDGKRVPEAELQPGQRFALGTTTFELVAEQPPPAPAPAVPLPAAAEPETEEEWNPEQTVSFKAAAELIAQLERPLDQLGEELVTTTNRPFLLSDPNAAFLLVSGQVEIFTVTVQQGQPVGQRSHFVSIEPGAMFFGLDAETLGFDSGFLVVGKGGSVLRRFDVDRLQQLAQLAPHAPRLAQLVDGWLTALSRRLVSDLPRVPDAKVLLRAGQAAQVPVGSPIGAGNQVVWFEVPAERFLFDGMEALSFVAEGVLFPVAPGSWLELLEAPKPIGIMPSETRQVVADPRLWSGLAVFHRLLQSCEFLNKRLSVVDEFNRLQRKAEQVEAAREAGVGAIESVLGGTRQWERPALISGAEIGPVYEACKRVAQATAIEVRRPATELDALSFEETIQAIATASRFRVRKVALTDDWWRHEHGALLAQREQGNGPVALVPRGRGYDYVDTVSGQHGALDAETAATLIPFAHSFYRPLPDGKVGARELIRFGLHGLRRDFREVGVMAIAAGVLGTATPAITGMVFDNAIPQAERGFLLQLTFGLFMVAAATSAFKITQNVAMMRVQSRMDYSVQAAIWDRLLDLPVTFFRGFSSGDLADRAFAVDKIRSIVAGAGVAAILGSFASIFNAIQMCMYHFSLAGVGIALTLLYVLLATGTNYLKLKTQRQEFTQRGTINGLVLQLINGVAKMRVTGTEEHAFRVWADSFSSMRKTAFTVGRISNFMPVLNNGYPVLASMAIFFTMVSLQKKALEKGEAFDMTTGDFLAFNAAFGIFLGAMQALGDASVNLLQILPIYERLRPVLDQEPEVDATKAAPAKLKGGIEISNVSFRYSEDSPWILKDVSLKIEPGEFVAFVGGSGSGKSTLLKVMLGFERPQKGSVYYDSQDLGTLDVRLVRQQIGVVLQESRLLPADIYRNIVGSSSRTLAEAWEAARKSGLADDIKRMPMQMHTYVSEGGGGFSGGQKQRLMIARAIVNNPKILYLDEATSALDNRTQKIVTESMDALQATRVVIAHRLSTIQNADKICYLDKGVLAEVGTYDELMKKDGLFAELARRQQA